MTVNRAELIKQTALETGFTQAEAKAVIDQFLDLILANVAHGEDVKLSGFGVFESVVRSEQTFNTVQDPAQTITLPPRRGMKFKASRLVRTELAHLPLVNGTSSNGRH